MKKRQSRLALVGALLLAVAPAACGGAADDQAEVDRELDLALAAADSAALADTEQKLDEQSAQTQGQAPSRAPTTTPQPRPQTTQPRPQPTPAASQYAQLTVASGTSFAVRLDQELSTRTSSVGDLFTVTTTAPLTDGSQVVVPAGTKIRGEITVAQASGGSGQPATLKVKFDDLTVDGQSYPVSLSITEAQVETKGRDSTGDKALKIGGGAAAGALIGQLIGKDTKSTLIGAAVGAAAGTGFQMTTQDVDAVLPEGSTMTVRLDEPLSVRKQTG
ncbi:MAG: YMGG-like glycine zipper-containing protein [Gemmatimonadota bacterium]